MFSQAENYQKIIMCLSVLRFALISNSKQGYFDDNKHAEDFFCQLLNIAYDWSLINVNKINLNYPAIDLGDQVNRVCVQVTVENDSPKIKKTISLFGEKGLSANYDRLIFLLINKKREYRTDFNRGSSVAFDNSLDIVDIDDLLQHIEQLDSARIELIASYVTKELNSIVSSVTDKSSLLGRLESTKIIQPENMRRLFDHKGTFLDEDEFKPEFQVFIEHIQKMPRQSREILSISLANSIDLKISPKEIRNRFGLQQFTLREEVRILEDKIVAYYDEDDKYLHFEYMVDGNYNMFDVLSTLLKNEKDFTRLLVDLDCSVLDT